MYEKSCELGPFEACPLEDLEKNPPYNFVHIQKDVELAVPEPKRHQWSLVESSN